jgi:cytochrome P450
VAAAARDPRLSSVRVPDVDAVPEEMRSVAAMLSHQMLYSDPPAHARLRNAVAQAFTPRLIAALEHRIQRLVDGMLDSVCSTGAMDITRDLAYPLPVTVIGDMLGLPASDIGHLKAWSDDIALVIGKQPLLSAEEAVQAVRGYDALSEYFAAIIAQHQAHRGDDLVDMLLRAGLTGPELLANCALLLVAGHETTTNLIGNGLFALLESPDQMRLVKADPGLTNGAVEELLRYAGPAQVIFRRAKQDLEMEGKPIRSGDVVLLSLAGANRDPAQFAEPDRLDVRRANNRHIAFGHGPHFCIGAALARLEARIVLDTLLRRVDNLGLNGPVVWQLNFSMRGLGTLPVRFSRPSLPMTHVQH